MSSATNPSKDVYQKFSQMTSNTKRTSKAQTYYANLGAFLICGATLVKHLNLLYNTRSWAVEKRQAVQDAHVSFIYWYKKRIGSWNPAVDLSKWAVAVNSDDKFNFAF